MEQARPTSSPPPPSGDPDSLARLGGWYASPLGQALEQTELTAIRETLANLFGFHLLLVAPPWQGSPLSASRISNQLVMPCRRPLAKPSQCSLVGGAQALPVCTDTLDLVILPHTLEFVAQPHEVLREVDRVLVPEGHVVILGFNPYGLWGLWRLLFGWRRRLPWTGRFISQTRLRDWLALLGFDILSCEPLFFRPPVRGRQMLHRLAFLDTLAERGWPLSGAAFVLLARKRVVGMTPLRPRWKPRRGLLAGGLIQPSRRWEARSGQRRELQDE